MNQTSAMNTEESLLNPTEDKDFYGFTFIISLIVSIVTGAIVGIITVLAKHSFKSFGFPAGPIISLVILLAGIISAVALHRSDKSISQGECTTSIITGEVLGYLTGYSVLFWLVHTFHH
jgi:hypothetical protein